MTELLNQLKECLNFIFKHREAREKENALITGINQFNLIDKHLGFIAIDGSYSFILDLSSLWLAIIRVGALEFELQNNTYKFKKNYSIETPVLVSAQERVVKEQTELHRLLLDSVKTSSEPHKEMVNEWRRILEHQLAIQLAENHESTIVCLDGTLSQLSKRFRYLPELIKICEKNRNILIGISKDSDTHAFGSIENDENLLRATKADKGYVRVPSHFEEKQQGLLYGDVYFTKLHPQAPKWFRVDLGTYKENPGFVFSNLEPYARSELCIGYPFPMLEAHRFVVTVRHFHEVYEDMVLEQLPKYNISIEDAIEGLTHFDGAKRSAYHEFLDKISREMR